MDVEVGDVEEDQDAVAEPDECTPKMAPVG